MKTNKTLLGAILILAVVFTACKNDKKEKKGEDATQEKTTEVKKSDSKKSLQFELVAKSNSTASGKVSFTEKDGEVHLYAKVIGLTPGTHAIHIHEKADCSAADGTSTGGHWNPTFENHGKWGAAEGYHTGDIGNFEADENGMGGIEFVTDEWCIGCGNEKKDIIGKAIIVHQAADDFVTQPTGNAGGRVSCGAIIQ